MKHVIALSILITVQVALSLSAYSNQSINQSFGSSKSQAYSLAIIEVLKILISIICLIVCASFGSSHSILNDSNEEDDSISLMDSPSHIANDSALRSPAYRRVSASASASENESDREKGKRSLGTPRNNQSIKYRQPITMQSTSIRSAFAQELRPTSLIRLVGLALAYALFGIVISTSGDQSVEQSPMLSPVTFAWTHSLALLALAVAYSVLPKRSSLTPVRWTAVAFQLFGCVVMFVPLWFLAMSNQLAGSDFELPSLFSLNVFVQVALLCVCLAGHEHIAHKRNSSIHVQNVLLACFGLVIQCVFGVIMPSYSMPSLSFVMMVLQATIFVASSAVLKYANAIVKCFGTVLAISVALYFESMIASISGEQNNIFLALSFIAMSLLALSCFLYMQTTSTQPSADHRERGATLRIVVDQATSTSSKSPYSIVALGMLGACLAIGFIASFSPMSTGLSSSLYQTRCFMPTPRDTVVSETVFVERETAAHTSLYPNPFSATYKERTAHLFQNFTVEGYLPTSRWPPGIDPSQSWSARYDVPELSTDSNQDPFRLGSPARFHDMRNVIISMFTAGAEPTLLEHFKNTDTNFLGPMKDHSDYVIFYTMFPVDAGAQLHHALTAKLDCKELTDMNAGSSRDPKISDIYARLRHPSLNFTNELRSIREFITPAGAHLITVPVAVNLPRHLAADPGKMFRPDYMTCWGTRWPLDYMLYSGAVFSSLLLRHPILRGYDYYIKIDLDIQWIKKYDRESIFHDMRSQECIWMHTRYMTRFEDCNIFANDTVSHWSESRLGAPPASAEFEWFQSTDYFYGNFVGGWLGWIRSPENSALGEWLYEDDKWAGYFRHRWGDQPPLAKMLGQWFKLNNTQAIGNVRSNDVFHPNKSTVCDYTVLRDNYFFHKKMFFEA